MQFDVSQPLLNCFLNDPLKTSFAYKKQQPNIKIKCMHYFALLAALFLGKLTYYNTFLVNIALKCSSLYFSPVLKGSFADLMLRIIFLCGLNRSIHIEYVIRQFQFVAFAMYLETVVSLNYGTRQVEYLI